MYIWFYDWLCVRASLIQKRRFMKKVIESITDMFLAVRLLWTFYKWYILTELEDCLFKDLA